jgi:AbrB family looped-hinge helix DNA binding protein
MRTAIDHAGRVVIPKPLRDRLGLTGSTGVEIDERDGVIEIRPLPLAVEVVETPDGPVAQPLEAVAPIDDTIVRNALERARR